MIDLVTGIDTGIGKTYATGMMARYLVRRGERVITQKLVQTGNSGFSEDLNLHRAMMGVGRFPEDDAGLTAPAVYPYPASPHLAAALEGRTVDPEAIAAAAARLAERYDYVLAEGAGGLAVPLTESLLTIDFAARYGYRVILVTSGRLGSLNHTILALEALAQRKMTLAGLVYNLSPAADPVIDADSRRMMAAALRRYGFPEVLVELPAAPSPTEFETPDFGALFPAGGVR